MSANDPLPWIAPLADLLRDAVHERVPVIGHCLGGQLFAQALGARVTRAAAAEIGWLDVEVTDAAARDAWFGGTRALHGVPVALRRVRPAAGRDAGAAPTRSMPIRRSSSTTGTSASSATSR